MRRSVSAALLASALAAASAMPAAAAPPERTTIADVAASSDDFEILTAAATALGLADALDGNRQFTVFAPTDAAFVQAAGVATEDEVIPALLGAFGAETVTEILLYHVAPGDRQPEDVISSSQVNTLLKGEKIPVSFDGATLMLDNATYQATVDVDNGVIHVIDEVMLPSSLG